MALALDAGIIAFIVRAVAAPLHQARKARTRRKLTGLEVVVVE
jgi:hypothetical protein